MKYKQNLDTRFGLGKMPDIIEDVDYDSVKVKYDEALYNLRQILTFAEGDAKKRAEKQFDDLVKKERILDLLMAIDHANNFKLDTKTKIRKVKKVKL